MADAGARGRCLHVASARQHRAASPAAASAGAGVGMGAMSPLSGPVLTNDDDDLFSMDEEK